MLYHGFYVRITPLKNILREDKDGNFVHCDGFEITIFSDESKTFKISSFTAAVGFEIINDSIQEAEQFAKDVIDSEEKEYIKILGDSTGSYI